MDEFIDYYTSAPTKVKVEVKPTTKAPEKVVKESKKEKEQKVVITESTKDTVEEELGEKIEDIAPEEIVEAVNKSKKGRARRKKNGDIEIKRSLNG